MSAVFENLINLKAGGAGENGNIFCGNGGGG